jgi:hypothetical protein
MHATDANYSWLLKVTYDKTVNPGVQDAFHFGFLPFTRIPLRSFQSQLLP